MAEYIDKQAVIDSLKRLPHEYKNAEQRARTGGIAACQMVVRNMEPVDVRPTVHGTWIEINDVSVAGKCSVCDWHAFLYEDDVVGMNYCPNCGAYMKGERVSEDD